MVLSNSSEPMFKFTTKLFVWKNRVKKSGNSSLYVQIYIYSAGTTEREYIPLDLEWALKYIDLDQSILLKRFSGDTDVNKILGDDLSEKKYNFLDNSFITELNQIHLGYSSQANNKELKNARINSIEKRKA